MEQQLKSTALSLSHDIRDGALHLCIRISNISGAQE